MVWRMLKNACLRPFRTLYARFRRATNVTRQASQIVPKVVKSVTTVKVKPKSRQDYVDAGPVYVAKSLIFIVIAVIIALWLLVQFVIWPWMESRWFTARLWMQEEKVETYSGRVQLYYDEEKQLLAFEGRLEEGKKTGKGAEYYESGLQAYVGAFEEDLYQGQGTQLDADGNVVYEGGFAQGLYQGEGKLYQDAKLVYEGEFDQGEYQGEGKLYQDEQLVYEGEFDQGERSGQGKAYSAGKLAYEGGFAQGLYSGSGKLYYPSGQLMAECLTFDAGQLNGTGVLYHENGQKKYEGSFAQDAYAGQGTLYDETGERTYYGGFEAGLQSGTGTEYYAGGRKKYEGGFVQGLYDGAGTLYNYDGTVLYTGGFAQGLYQGDGTLNLEGGYSVQGVFAAGQVSGRIRYYQGTDLLYEGELVNGNAQGEGVLHPMCRERQQRLHRQLCQWLYRRLLPAGYGRAAAARDRLCRRPTAGKRGGARLYHQERRHGYRHLLQLRLRRCGNRGASRLPLRQQPDLPLRGPGLLGADGLPGGAPDRGRAPAHPGGGRQRPGLPPLHALCL